VGPCPHGYRGRNRARRHAGGILLRKLADRCGLTAALDGALAQRGTFPQLSRGMVPLSVKLG
jgi:hypothetical protein